MQQNLKYYSLNVKTPNDPRHLMFMAYNKTQAKEMIKHSKYSDSVKVLHQLKTKYKPILPHGRTLEGQIELLDKYIDDGKLVIIKEETNNEI